MATGAAMAGGAAIGGIANYMGSKEQADARRAAAKTANAPYRQKAPFLQDLYQMGSQATQDLQGGNVQLNENLQEGLNQQAELARQMQEQGFGQGVQDFGQTLLSGQYLTPENNPALQGNLDAITQQTTENFNRNVLPQATADAAGAGQLGSSRQGVIEANAMDDFQENLNNQISQMIMQNFMAERERQMQAPGMIQQGAQMQMTPGSILQGVGQDEEAARRAEAFDGLQQLGQLLGVGPNQQVAPQPGPSPTQNAISGGLGGASTAAGIMQALRMSNQGRGGAATGRGPGGYPVTAYQ